ncbi:hypothetical protein IU471_10605 [Nocardia elegans]|uniref:hypothetical protein n=1 Tax=Nocardia elegans TaxID=300029 RepID=UPI001894B3FE|nr:hypothetical protein [Nocardia elegans]MBF6244029.1 hypothetical protein [Nocardia elegans]
MVELFSVCQDPRDRLLDSSSDAGRHREMDIARQKTDGCSSAHAPGAGSVVEHTGEDDAVRRQQM